MRRDARDASEQGGAGEDAVGAGPSAVADEARAPARRSEALRSIRQSEALLSIRGLAKRYGGARGRTVFEAVDLDVVAGEYVAIMGESGVGKSTLLNLVAGLDTPDSGTIVFDGVDLAALDDDRRTVLRRERMGFVFQAFHILPHLDLVHNVALPLTLSGLPRAECMQRAQAMLAEVGLADRAASLPRELSGGELQRVAIARALVGSPKLVLADEPTGNLDADNARAVLALLREVVASHRAAGLLVTHSLRAARTADRIVTLQRGGLVERAFAVGGGEGALSTGGVE